MGIKKESSMWGGEAAIQRGILANSISYSM